MTVTQTSISLLADVGGTNSRMAIARDGVLDHKTIRRYANRGHSGFEAIVTQYLAEEGIAACDDTCVAIAGPISNGVARMTNLDWEIRPEVLAKASGAARAVVLNDLQAQGQALGHLAKNALRPLIEGKPAPARCHPFGDWHRHGGSTARRCMTPARCAMSPPLRERPCDLAGAG